MAISEGFQNHAGGHTGYVLDIAENLGAGIQSMQTNSDKILPRTRLGTRISNEKPEDEVRKDESHEGADERTSHQANANTGHEFVPSLHYW